MATSASAQATTPTSPDRVYLIEISDRFPSKVEAAINAELAKGATLFQIVPRTGSLLLIFQVSKPRSVFTATVTK